MYLLIIILDKAKDMENLLRKFKEIGITGATVFDSVGVGRNTLYGTDMPVIASLKRIFDPESRTYNHTLFSIIRNRETVDKALEAAQEVCGDFSMPDVGIMFTIKLEDVIGFETRDKADAE
jgi:nitrogen regulatory protein P-II 1